MATTSKREEASGRESWPVARLIPTAGIKGDEERERRATSSLLAVIHAVPEFGHALLKELGAPKSPTIETFTEVRLTDASGATVIPDGAIVCRRGGRTWTALVEVKTKNAPLRPEQVSSYLEVARDNGFDGVLTISNDITADSASSPVSIDGRKLRKASLWHFSWWRILTEAIVQHRHRGVSDPDQAWILGELIAYLDSEASGANGFTDMGPNWVTVRTGAQQGTLRAADKEVREVAGRWEQLTQFLCLGLSQDLGAEVTSPRPRAQTASGLIDELAKSLASEGRLAAPIRVPDAVGDMAVCADLRAKRTSVSVRIDAPREGKPKVRINWLLRQLADAPGDTLIEAVYPSARQTISATLEQARDDVERLIYPADPKREARSFIVSWARPIGTKRGRGEGAFATETREQIISFYGELVQNIKPWQARAPKLSREPQPEATQGTPTPEPPPFSAPGARDPGAAPDPAADMFRRSQRPDSPDSAAS